MSEIWIIEDEERISAVLSAYLSQAGFNVRVFADGQGIVAAVSKQAPALLLLDLMLPGMDGLDICRAIRRFSSVPILIITARAEEIDRLIGLELGADDYICKPFSPREVVARVKNVLRRVTTTPDPVQTTDSDLQHAGIRLNAERFECELDQQPLTLTPKEFKVLQILLSQPGYLFSREQLLSRAYPDDTSISDRMIDTHIKNLRKKLHEIRPQQDFIQAIYSMGYKFID